MTLFTGNVVAVVTGAGSGIGRATAIAFARDGCQKISLGDLSIPGMQETRRLVNEKCPQAEVCLSRVDVSDETSVEEFYSATVQKFGRIDYGANIAGIAQAAAPIHLSPDEAFDKMYAVNQKGAFLCERALIRQFLKQERRAETQLRGSVVIVTSQLAEVTCNGMAAYSASKAGARGLSRSDALDYGPEGIRFNTIGPGPTSTPLLLGAQEDKYIRLMERATPLRRNARPEDIANAVVWLSSDRACFITGVSLIVDGGMGLQMGPD